MDRTLIHAELVLGGFVTGSVIGFFWHPAAAILALLTTALISLRASQGEPTAPTSAT